METEVNGMTKQPSYRFAGYTEAWEQKKLGAYLTVSKNRNVDGEYDKSDVLSVSGDYGIVNQIKFQGRSFAGASVLPYGIVETGDVVYTKSPLKANPYGIIKTNHGKNGIVSTLYAVYKVNNGSNGIFVEYYFDDNLRLNKYLKPLVNKGAKNDMKVTDENVLKGDVIFPSLPEQTAIGSFFQDIDHLISLQRRRLEVLKEQKKTYLKLLFPVKGQTKPALRFTGFEDEWKEVKLGKVLTERNIQMVPSDKVPLVSFTVENGVTPKTERYNREFLVREYSKKYKYTRYNDIVYNPANLKFGAIARNKYGEAVFSPIYVTFEANYSNILPEFIEGILTSKDFIQRALKFQEGTVYERMAVKADDFRRLAITVPSLPEQQAIGSFFQDLDKAIAKQEEKVNQLKESKQTFLKKMFI